MKNNCSIVMPITLSFTGAKKTAYKLKFDFSNFSNQGTLYQTFYGPTFFTPLQKALETICANENSDCDTLIAINNIPVFFESMQNKYSNDNKFLHRNQPTKLLAEFIKPTIPQTGHDINLNLDGVFSFEKVDINEVGVQIEYNET